MASGLGVHFKDIRGWKAGTLNLRLSPDTAMQHRDLPGKNTVQYAGLTSRFYQLQMLLGTFAALAAIWPHWP